HLINDKHDIRPEWLEGARRVGVTAGASTPEFLVAEVVEELKCARPAEVREVHVVEEDVRFGLPRELEEMARRGGKALPPRSSADHAAERGAAAPDHPVYFTKPGTAVVGPGDEVIHHAVTSELDYEVELAVVIGTGGRDIPRDGALAHVFGYTVINDVTARD